MDSFSNIILCPRVDGSFTKAFCCSAKAGGPAVGAGCCDREVQIDIIPGPGRTEASAISMSSPFQSAKMSNTAIASTPTGNLPVSSSIPTSTNIPAFTDVPVSISILASTASASSLSAVAKSLPQQLPLSQKNVKIGVAIGVSLSVCLISGLIMFLLHERRLRIKAQKEVVDTSAACKEPRAPRTSAGSYGKPTQSRPQELELTQPQHRELYDGEIHEADTRSQALDDIVSCKKRRGNFDTYYNLFLYYTT